MIKNYPYISESFTAEINHLNDLFYPHQPKSKQNSILYGGSDWWQPLLQNQSALPMHLQDSLNNSFTKP